MSISDFISEVNHALDKLVQQMEQVNPVDIGLDQRSSCGPLYINSEWIVSTSASAGVLNYYGGFEYVDSHCVLSMGDYVLYSAEHSRVKRHIRRWETNTLSEQEREAALENEDY
jgi:hypothetical protein